MVRLYMISDGSTEIQTWTNGSTGQTLTNVNMVSGGQVLIL